MTMPACPPANEAGRLDALRDCNILDTGPEPTYDDLTRLAALICGTSIALVSLVDSNRQWFKSSHGLDATETHRDASFCSHAILQHDLFVVPDALADERFRDNPLVTGEPHLRFYAGMPLTDPQGFNLGALCVLDRVPRQLTASQRDALGVLARQVMATLQLRRQMAVLEKTQAHLRESEERFRAFMDNSPTVAFMKDEDGRAVYINEALRRRFDIEDDADWIGKTDAELFPADVARSIRKNDLAVMAGGKTVKLLETVPTPDGTSHHWQVYKFPFTDSTGKRFLAGMGVDVTAEKNAEDALRESEDRFRSVVEELAEGVVLIDMKSKAVLRANRAFLDLLGYSHGEVAGLIQYDIVAHDRADIDAKMALIVSQRRMSLGFRKYRHKSGTLVDVSVSGSLLFLRGRAVVCLVVRDVTDEKASQDAMRYSEEKFRSVVDRLSEGVFLLDVRTKAVLETNSAALQLYGYTAAEMAGATLYDLATHSPASVDANCERILDKGRHNVGRRKHRRKDGSVIDVELSASLVYHGGRQVFCVVARDVTEQQQHEERLLEYQRELEGVNGKLRALAVTDGLTGIKNRAAFDDRFAEEFDRARRNGRVLSVLMLDVDRFKQYNDAFGHPSGDEVLRAVARLLQRTARQTDFVARYGGEEFAVLLPDTDRDGAMSLAERFRQAVKENEWTQRAITISVGAASLNEDTTNPLALLNEADEALYRSKDRGRDRVTHSDDALTVPFSLEAVCIG